MSGDGRSVSLGDASAQRVLVSSGCPGALGEMVTRVPMFEGAATPGENTSLVNSHAQSSCELGALDGVESEFCSWQGGVAVGAVLDFSPRLSEQASAHGGASSPKRATTVAMSQVRCSATLTNRKPRRDFINRPTDPMS
jgi:hypothetical protein